jgi:hypothetical protein
VSIENGSAPSADQQTSTVNQASQGLGATSLHGYLDSQATSSIAGAAQQQAGVASPDTGGNDNREQYIPRSRFDEVNTQKNLAQQQAQILQQQLQLYQQQLAQGQQAQSVTGMQGQQTPPQAQGQRNIPDFNDPGVQREWRNKIADNPVTGLREFVSLLIQAEGAPMLQQVQSTILSQVQPIQQTIAHQQIQSYTQSRSQADPSFGRVKPVFENLVAQAVQRGYMPNGQLLQAIEGIARAQTGLFNSSAGTPQAPYTERPGGTGSFGQPATPNLSPLERQIAQRFGMSETEYAQYRSRVG